MSVAYPYINGVRWDYSSIEFELGAMKRVFGIKEINYSDTMEPGLVYGGSSPQPLGRTRGVYSSEGSFSIYREEYGDFMAYLSSGQPPPLNGPGTAGTLGVFETVFDVTLNFGEQGQQQHTDRLVSCRVKKRDKGFSQSADPLVVKVDLSILRVDEFISPNALIGIVSAQIILK